MAQDNPLRQDFAARLKLLVTAFGLSLCALADRSRVGRCDHQRLASARRPAPAVG